MADNTTNKAEEQRKQTLEKAQTYLELLQAQDWDKWISLWADDAILEFPFAPKNRPSIYRGKQDILTYMSSTTRSTARAALPRSIAGSCGTSAIPRCRWADSRRGAPITSRVSAWRTR